MDNLYINIFSRNLFLVVYCLFSIKDIYIIKYIIRVSQIKYKSNVLLIKNRQKKKLEKKLNTCKIYNIRFSLEINYIFVTRGTLSLGL